MSEQPMTYNCVTEMSLALRTFQLKIHVGQSLNSLHSSLKRGREGGAEGIGAGNEGEWGGEWRKGLQRTPKFFQNLCSRTNEKFLLVES